MDEIKFQYVPEANPDGRSIPGVPLADLTAAEFNEMPGHVQRAVRAVPFYQEVPTADKGKSKKSEKADDKAKDEAAAPKPSKE